MKKGAKKKQNKRNTQLQAIEEIKLIDIFSNINETEVEHQNVIQKLEEQLPENQEIVMLSLLNFYLKIIGLDRCNSYIKEQNLENIRLEETINKLEQLQQENQLNLIDEEQCLKVENNENLKSFFETLFSQQTSLPQQCNAFYKHTFDWLAAASQTKFRSARLAAIELINIIINSILNELANFENQQYTREVLKFINNMFEYLISNRTQDVQTSIKKKTIQIIFSAFGNSQISQDPYFSQLGQLFLSDSHECREASIVELEKILKQTTEGKKSFEPILEFLSIEQEAVISLIYDPNESVQLKLINFFKQLSKQVNIEENFFKSKTCQAFIRILFAKNLRIRYEAASILHLFIKPIKSIIKITEFYLQYAPFDVYTYEDCFNFLISFIHSHPFICSPEQYTIFFENGNQQEIFVNLGLYFFASILQFQQGIQKLWWIDETDQQLEYSNAFTNFYLTKMKTSIDLLDENFLLPHLHICQNLNFKILQTKDLKNLMASSMKIFQKSQNIQIVNQLCKMLQSCLQQQQDSDCVNQLIKEITKYSQKVYKDKPNVLTLEKIDCLIKNNIAQPKQILNPFNQIFEIPDKESVRIISSLLSSCLQNQLRNYLNNMKGQENDIEQSYKDIREQFYNYTLSILENRNKEEFHFHVLQLIAQNLVYTNNFKLQRLNLHQAFEQSSFSLIYFNIYDFLFCDLLKQAKQQNETNENKKKRVSLSRENLPQLSLGQMELLNNCIKILNQCPTILINRDFGLQVLSNLLELVKNHQYFKELRPSVLAAVQQSIQKIVEFDQLMKKDDFWKFLIEYAHQKYQSQSEEVFHEFVKCCLNAYLASVTKQNVDEKRVQFINHCAEMIQAAFQDIRNLFLIGLLNNIFSKPNKLLKTLQINKLTYQKFYAFYETKSAEYHSSDRPEEERKEVQKSETAFRTKLKQQTGLTMKDINKIVTKVQKSGTKQSIEKSELNANQRNSEKNSEKKSPQIIDDDDEMEIPFSKQMIK